MSPRRWALLRVIATTMAERGFQGVGMREIGQVAGLNPGTLYHHFKSKDDVLLTICRIGQTRSLADIDAVLAGSTTLRTRIAQLFALHNQSLSEIGDFIQVYSNHRLDLPADIGAELVESWAVYRLRVIQLFEEAAAQGEIATGLQPSHLGRILVSQLRVLNQIHRAGRPQELAAFADLSASIIMAGLPRPDCDQLQG